MRQRKAEEWAKWRGLVAEQMASGQSVAAFCRERGLRDWKFYEWKNLLRQAEAGQFVAVEVRSAEPAVEPATAPGKAIEIRLARGRSLVAEPGFDAAHLRALLVVVDTRAEDEA